MLQSTQDSGSDFLLKMNFRKNERLRECITKSSILFKVKCPQNYWLNLFFSNKGGKQWRFQILKRASLTRLVILLTLVSTTKAIDDLKIHIRLWGVSRKKVNPSSESSYMTTQTRFARFRGHIRTFTLGIYFFSTHSPEFNNIYY